MIDLEKSIIRQRAIKPRPGVRVEPLEFTSSGGRVRLRRISRQVKSCFLPFYENIKYDEQEK